jgi:hypothetical protein
MGWHESTFRSFKRAVEGHLLQVGAGYLTQSTFINAYNEDGENYLTSSNFWNTYQISFSQALYDKQYLFGIIMTATMKLQHKTIIKYEHSLDGILAWYELKQEFEYDGSEDLRLEQLEALSNIKYTGNEPGGMQAYIDRFQAYMAELTAIKPNDYNDDRKKRLLLINIRQAQGVAHLVQKCRDNEYMSFEKCAAYLRSNSMLIDTHNEMIIPSRLMKVEDITQNEPEPQKSLESVSKMFHTMAEENGLENSFRMFNTRVFRESLSIPTSIWMELKPAIQEEINKIRQQVREQCLANPNPHQRPPQSYKSVPKDEKIPNQYPTMKQKSTAANLVNSIPEMDLESDDDTDDEAFHMYMTKTKPVPDTSSSTINVRAHFEYCADPLYHNSICAIADGGADSCILGKHAKVLSYTGRFANLVGYDPETTRTDKVPIVTALLKVKSAFDNIPIILKVHEAPYNPSSPITLLSEYQIREYELVIDSVAKKH